MISGQMEDDSVSAALVLGKLRFKLRIGTSGHCNSLKQNSLLSKTRCDPLHFMRGKHNFFFEVK